MLADTQEDLLTWKALIPMGMLTWKAPVTRMMLTWKAQILRKMPTWKALIARGILWMPAWKAPIPRGMLTWKDTSPQGDAELEGSIYPGRGAFSPAPKRFFQLATGSGHQLSQGPLQELGLGTHSRSGIRGWLR